MRKNKSFRQKTLRPELTQAEGMILVTAAKCSPVAVPGIFLADGAASSSADRGHSLRSLDSATGGAPIAPHRRPSNCVRCERQRGLRFHLLVMYLNVGAATCRPQTAPNVGAAICRPQKTTHNENGRLIAAPTFIYSQNPAYRMLCPI